VSLLSGRWPRSHDRSYLSSAQVFVHCTEVVTFSAMKGSQNCEKRQLRSSRLSVCPPGATMDGVSCNLIPGDFR
jgi:hypothetical protein